MAFTAPLTLCVAQMKTSADRIAAVRKCVQGISEAITQTLAIGARTTASTAPKRASKPRETSRANAIMNKIVSRNDALLSSMRAEA